MSKNDGTFDMMYDGFVIWHNGSILPLSAVRGGQEEKLPKENTMEDKRAEELQRKISQYELVVDLLAAAYKYSGVLTIDYILTAMDTALEILEQDLDNGVEDTPGGVEDSPQKTESDYQYTYVPPTSWTMQTASFADFGPTPAPGDEENTP